MMKLKNVKLYKLILSLNLVKWQVVNNLHLTSLTDRNYDDSDHLKSCQISCYLREASALQTFKMPRVPATAMDVTALVQSAAAHARLELQLDETIRVQLPESPPLPRCNSRLADIMNHALVPIFGTKLWHSFCFDILGIGWKKGME